VIQATQNRSDRAVQTKLDELIRAGTETRNRVIDLEDEDLSCCGREGIYSA
jgi:low affinity Fe/Cu permease